MWFKQKRDAGLCLDGEILRTKATEFATMLGLEKMDLWKSRHGILFKVISGKTRSLNNEGVSDWKEDRLRDILRKYRAEDIYNVDESALFWKILPDQTLAFKKEKIRGFSLLVIVKFSNPHCF